MIINICDTASGWIDYVRLWEDTRKGKSIFAQNIVGSCTPRVHHDIDPNIIGRSQHRWDSLNNGANKGPQNPFEIHFQVRQVFAPKSTQMALET